MLGFYVALLAWGLAHHEIWRDEAQAWLLARSSDSPAALLRAMRYEGHPALWHLLLFVLSRLTASPVAMQALHAVVATIGVAMLLFLAPFPLWLRSLLALGYLPLFEYGVISRNYALALPLLWGVCALHGARPRRWWAIAALVALLACCNPYAWLLALALVGAFAGEAWPDRRVRALGPGLLAAAGIFAALLQMIPPRDAQYGPPVGFFWGGLLARTLGTPLVAYLPLPDPRTVTPWNSALAYRLPAPLLAALGVLAVVGLAVLLPRGVARRLFVLGSAILLAFTYARYIGWARHHAHHVLLLVACCWLAAQRDARVDTADGRRRARTVALATIAVVHLAAGAWLYAADLRGPFSDGAAIARALALPPFAGLPVYGVPDPPLTTLAALRAEPARSLRSGQPVTYLVWRRGANEDLAPGAFCPALQEAVAQHPDGIALVLTRPYALPCAGVRVTATRTTPRALVPSERLLLWRVEIGEAAPGAVAAPTPKP